LHQFLFFVCPFIFLLVNNRNSDTYLITEDFFVFE